MKLAKELSKRSTGRTLYILDEPTTGLHFYDIEQLLGVLHRLRDEGNTIVVIEHNLDVIKTADWVIDLGPEGGAGGGTIVATGTPEEIAANEQSLHGAVSAAGAGETAAESTSQAARKKRAAGPALAAYFAPASRLPGDEHLVHFALRDRLFELAARVRADDRAPELHGRLVVDELDDFPGARRSD